jgi:hypothetical protein
MAENSRLGQIISKNQEKEMQQTIDDLNNKIRAAEYQALKAEERSIIALNELRMKQEDYDKLSSYAEELKM